MTASGIAMLAATPGCCMSIAALAAAGKTARRQAAALRRTREEFESLLVQQQTEFLDGIGQVGRTVEFLERSAQQTEAALRDRLTPSLRAKALQLLRSGLSPDTAAATLALSRSEVRLIAAVSRVLSVG